MSNSDDLVDSEALSIQVVFGIFDRAYMRPEWASDGDIIVRGRSGLRYRVNLMEDSASIRVIFLRRFTDGIDSTDKLEAVNNLKRFTCHGKILKRLR